MNPKFFDAHGHVNFVAYKDDREEVVTRTLEAGVWQCVVGTQKDTSKKAVEVAEKYEAGVYAAVGLHPVHTDKSYHDKEELGQGGEEFTSRGEVFNYQYYKELAGSEKVVAIGECGLDYYTRDTGEQISETRIKKQEDAFRQQIELSVEVGKPLMLHLRDGNSRSAYKDALRVLSDYDSSKLRGDLHFFAGSIEEAKLFLDLGFNFSFTGAITYPPRKGQSVGSYDALIKYLPIDRILSETDCPYVSPVPYRGKRNEPLYVVEVVKKIAEVKGQDLQVVSERLLENALLFFKLRK